MGWTEIELTGLPRAWLLGEKFSCAWLVWFETDTPGDEQLSGSTTVDDSEQAQT